MSARRPSFPDSVAGTSGDLTTLEPQLSPTLWTGIATEKMAYHHGVPGFTEVDPGTGRRAWPPTTRSSSGS